MQKLKNKLIVNIIVLIFLIGIVAMFAACEDKSTETIKSGVDSFGRTYGQIYDIDEYKSGTYSIVYEIEDTSTMGKSMISKYCEDYVIVNIDEGICTLTFYCSGNMLDNVKLGKDDIFIEGQSMIEGDKYGYKFDIQRDMLDDKMAMSTKVKLMGKEVKFSIRVDLTKAVLVG